MNNIKKLFIALFSVLFAVLFIIFAEETAVGVVKSIGVCINVIIPSMFIYMVLSTFIINSGIYEIIFTPLYKILHKIIKLDKQLFSVFCLSLIGGYPVGIKLFKEAIAQNKNYSAIVDKTAAFCYCISPTFAITMIGINLYHSAEIGLIVYISNVISCFIMAIIYTNIYNLKSNHISVKQNGNLIQAINSSASALVGICAVIVIFNAVIAVGEAISNIIGAEIPIMVKSVLEISSVLNIKSPTIAILPLISAIASSGGICVLFQCISIIQKSFCVKNFILARIPTALLSSLISVLILKFWNISLPSISENRSYIFDFNGNNAVLIFILIMCVILLQKNEKIFKKG